MRPIKLKLRGFLTYKNQIEIDFRKLYDKKIFVISGDTGSGKTSIFDAINFALYGSVARDIPVDRLRSDFLTGEDPYTFVNLVFQIDEKVYEIERIPSQIAHKSKDFQDIKNSVALYDITDEAKLISEKINDTRDNINQIIGLDQNQFSKVMLLAQGDFQQFLNAKSDDRTKLLGDIFKTQAYKDIQEKIKLSAKDASKNIEIIEQRLENILYRFDEISSIISREDILVHDFKNIVSSLDKYKAKIDKNLQDLSKKEKYFNDLEKEKLIYRQESENLNKNIELFNNVKTSLDEAKSKEEYYKDLKEYYDKSKQASNIEVYEKLLSKTLSELKDLKRKLELEKNTYKDLEKEFKDISSKYDLVSKEQERVNKLRLSLNENEKLLSDYKKFLSIKKKYKSFEKDLEDIEVIKKDKKNLTDKLNNERKSYDKISEKINESKDEKNNLEKDLFNINRSLEKLDQDFKAYEKNKELREKISINKDKIQSLEEENNKLKSLKEKYQENIRLNYINIMLDELNKTGICPVCGDRHAKNFSKYDIEDIDIEDLTDKLIDTKSKIESLSKQNKVYEELFVKVESIDYLKDRKANLITEYKSHKAKIDKLNSNLNNYLNISNELRKSLDKISKELNRLDDILSKLEESSLAFEKIKATYLSNKETMESLGQDELEIKIKNQRQSISDLEKEIKKTTLLYNELTNKITRIQSDIKNINANINKLEKEKSRNKKDFDNKLDELFDSYDYYKSYLDSYKDLSNRKEEIDKYFSNLEKLNIVYQTYLPYKDKDKVDIEKIDKDLSSIDQKVKVLRDDKSSNNLKLSNVDLVYKDLLSIEEEFSASKKDSEILSKLSKISDGSFAKLAGREKIDFESFVLTYYFDKVLSYANIRLLDMSDGQFSMVRKSVGNDARSKQGLDIEILDANTGKKRPASTLSGGESFLASLSLALGLSDEISVENGGITIDTLFIDEGFGTLSDDYLNNVIKQIEKLSYENKFIGLISHVKDLKEAIDAKILVDYRQDEGSNIEVIV